MLFRHRNAVVRQRTATVQEQKLKLREREVILEETVATARMGRVRKESAKTAKDQDLSEARSSLSLRKGGSGYMDIKLQPEDLR
jgi:hypothetical protein